MPDCACRLGICKCFTATSWPSTGSEPKMRFISRSFAGLWLGLWFIAGTAMSVGGILVLTAQFHGKLTLGFWPAVTMGGVYRLLEITVPPGPSMEIQRV